MYIVISPMVNPLLDSLLDLNAAWMSLSLVHGMITGGEFSMVILLIYTSLTIWLMYNGHL